MKNNQKGFTPLAIILIIVIIGLVGIAGWKVYDARKSPKARTTATTSSPPKTTQIKDETADWKMVTSGKGGFSLKIPDGWKVYSFKDNDFMWAGRDTEADITYTPGKAAVFTELPEGGFDGPLRFSVSQYPETENVKPVEGDETIVDFAIGSIAGKKYYKQQPASGLDGPGPNALEKDYTYVFHYKSKLTYIHYAIYQKNSSSIQTDDQDRLALIEQVVKTLQIN